jgi:hypothetical protein
MNRSKLLSTSILIVLALLLSVVKRGNAQISPSPQLTPLKSEQRALDADKPANNKNEANQDQNPISAQHKPSATTSSKDTANEISDSDKLTYFTGALVIVGVVQSIILWFTVVVSRASVRAYIFARCENAAGIAINEKPRIVIVLKNFGNSPAYKVRMCAQIAFDEYPMKRDPSLKYDRPYSPRMTISQGVEYGNPIVASTVLTSEHLAEIAEHKGQMFVYGKIRYTTLRMRRYTTFAFFILDGKLPMMAPFGNDAN